MGPIGPMRPTAHHSPSHGSSMEHGLILLIEAILAIDRHLQKPLRHVIPDVARLRTEPAAYLATEEVIVGPRRPYAVATVLGLMLAIPVLVGFELSALDNPGNGPGAGHAEGARQ